MSATQQLLRFGIFELNLATAELRKSGTLIKLPPQPFQLLVMLASHAGQVVTRDAIQMELWSVDSEVDFEHGMRQCITQIRTVLGDNAESPRYVETVPRQGYRFLAPVTSKTIAAPAPQVEQQSTPSGVENAIASRVLAKIAASAAATPTGASAHTPAATGAPERRSIRELSSGMTRTRLVVAFVGLIALIAASGLFWHAHKEAALTEKDTIVLADFDNKTGDPIFDGTLKMALAIQLEQSPFLNVLSDQRVNGTLKLMDRPANERPTTEVAREVCLRTNSRALLAGSIAPVGEHYLIAVKAVDCQTEDTLAGAEAEAENRNKVLKALNQVGNQLRGRLGESLASVKKFDRPLEEATTSSLEALQDYSRARRARLTGDADPIPYLKHALELDPNFAEAYARLGPEYQDMKQSSLAIENYKKAYELRDQVSQRERFYIEAHYYADATGQLEKAIPIFTEWSQTYPAAWEPHVNLSYHYMQLGQYDKSVEEAKTAIRLVPDSVIAYRHLVEAYNYMNQPAEAIVTFNDAQTRKLDDNYLHLSRYYSAFLGGDEAAMQQEVAWATGKPGAEDLMLSAQAETEAYYGRIDKARDFSQRASELAEHAEAQETAALWRANEALREAEVGNNDRARQAATQALAIATGRDVEALAALALARAGDAAGAQRLVDKLQRDFPLDTIMQGHFLPTIRAAIELGKNNPRAAIEILQAATPYEMGSASSQTLYPAYVRGQAYLKAGQGKQAAAEFQKLLDHRGLVGNFVLGALVYLQIGRANALAGDTGKAKAAYEDFFTLWRNADPDIPVLIQAKAEYGRLR